MRRLQNTAFILGGLACGLAASCKDEDGGTAGGVRGFCEALGGYVSDCDELNSCERALSRDCDPLAAILADAYVDATAGCVNGLGKIQDCFADGVELTPASSALESFATALCLECGDGAGSCEGEVLGGDTDSELGRAGRLARVLSGRALSEVQDECTTGDDCLAGFDACAVSVLSRDIPDNTADCLADAVADRHDDSCDGGSQTDSTSGPGTDDPTVATNTNPTLPTDPTDTDSGTGTGTDTDTCMTEGCPCQFNEDCLDLLMCLDDVCVASAECGDDTNEPNDGEQAATLLPPIDDDDDSGSSVVGELAGPRDVDWFRYQGSDGALAVVSPYAQVNVNALELCIYFECLNGLENTEVTCPKGTTQQPSGGGLPGCCASNTAGFEPELGCMSGVFGDDSAFVYMTVGDGEAGICQEYTLTYNY